MRGSKACTFPGFLFHTPAPEALVTETMIRNTALGSKPRTMVMILQFWEIIISSNLKHLPAFRRNGAPEIGIIFLFKISKNRMHQVSEG